VATCRKASPAASSARVPMIWYFPSIHHPDLASREGYASGNNQARTWTCRTLFPAASLFEHDCVECPSMWLTAISVFAEGRRPAPSRN
jgi:hypothetical protein